MLNLGLKSENDSLKNELIRLKEEIRCLNEELNISKSTKALIDRITKGKIEWYDYFKLTPQQQRDYYAKAKDALSNEAIRNEINKIISECANWCLCNSEKYEDVWMLRYQISGMKLLLERLEEIPNPDYKTEPPEDPYSAI